MRCLVEELVMPRAGDDDDGKADRPTIVAFNEDAGLATVATGTRAQTMQAGTGSPFENGYLETAIWADLDFD
jgi:hypothetical protein